MVVSLVSSGPRRKMGVGSRLPVRPRKQRHTARRIDAAPANRHETKAIVPVPRELAEGGFQDPALGDLGYRGKRLAEAGQALGIPVETIVPGRDRQFVPAGICWIMERSFAWLSRHRRLNTILERSKEHLVAFVAIAFISILARRLKRLVVEECSG